MLREAVRGDLLELRPRLHARAQARRGAAAHRAVGRARRQGLPRREPAGGVRRGRPRDVRPGRGGRGDRRPRELAAADRGLARDRRQHPRPARHDDQKERWLRGIAAGTTKVAFAITEPDAGTNSHNLSTTLASATAASSLSGQKTYISGVEDADAVLVVARTRLEDGALGLPSLAIVDVDAPGFTRDEIPMPYLGAGQAVAALLRRRRGRARTGCRRRERRPRPVFDGLNPERIMGAAIACGAGRRRSRRRRTTRASATSGARRSAPTRDLAPARPGEDRARAGAADDPEGGRALRRGRARRGRGPTWPSTRRPRRRSTASTRRSRPTAATASRSSTG